MIPVPRLLAHTIRPLQSKFRQVVYISTRILPASRFSLQAQFLFTGFGISNRTTPHCLAFAAERVDSSCRNLSGAWKRLSVVNPWHRKVLRFDARANPLVAQAPLMVRI